MGGLLNAALLVYALILSHTSRITASTPAAVRNGACCGSDEAPVGEGCAAPVVRAGEEPGYCSLDFYQQSKKSATESTMNAVHK